MTDWPALLDAMEAGLEVFPPVVVGALPAGLGPLPLALQDRAVRLLGRMAEAEATLDARRAEVGRQLVALLAARSVSGTGPAPNVPHFLDTRA